jgi:fructose-1,6-bisphosphatase
MFRVYESLLSQTHGRCRSTKRKNPESDRAMLAFETLDDALANAEVEAHLAVVVRAIASGCAEIAQLLRAGSPGIEGSSAVGTFNPFGDEQLEIDMRSNGILMKNLRNCGAVATLSSEEEPSEISLGVDMATNKYSVAFDPLDGSSIVDCNWSVGTIVSC